MTRTIPAGSSSASLRRTMENTSGIPEWLRKKMERSERRQLEDKLSRQVANGEITAEEADMEWLEFMHRSEVWSEF